MRPKCPCRDCFDRTVTCHGVCRKYKNWKLVLEEATIAKQKENDKYSDQAKKRMWKRRGFK